MTLITWQYFFMLLKSFSSCFLPSSSCHFLQYLVKAFFLDLCLQEQSRDKVWLSPSSAPREVRVSGRSCHLWQAEPGAHQTEAKLPELSGAAINSKAHYHSQYRRQKTVERCRTITEKNRSLKQLSDDCHLLQNTVTSHSSAPQAQAMPNSQVITVTPLRSLLLYPDIFSAC